MLALAILSLLSGQSSLVTSAQKRKSGPAASQRRKVVAAPSPTPTPSILDLLGEPPAPPARPTQTDQEVNIGDVISVHTTEVMLPVTVRDSGGRFVNELSRRDFRVFEDGREQPLSDFALRQVPVDVILMVDSSSSVASNIDDFRRAAEGFTAQLEAEDRISLIKFDDRIQLLQNWTNSRYQLRRALNRIEPGMFTRFNDALLLAAREQFTPSKSRRALIVLSDGIDNGGRATVEGVLRALLEAQATVYVVSNTEMSRATKRAELDALLNGTDSTTRFNQLRINDLREGLRVLDQSESMLAQLAAATGGKLYKPKSFNALDSTYAEVAEELRHQYALYYTPTNRTRDGTFRRVRVETANPDYQTHTRIGYFAPRG